MLDVRASARSENENGRLARPGTFQRQLRRRELDSLSNQSWIRVLAENIPGWGAATGFAVISDFEQQPLLEAFLQEMSMPETILASCHALSGAANSFGFAGALAL